MLDWVDSALLDAYRKKVQRENGNVKKKGANKYVLSFGGVLLDKHKCVLFWLQVDCAQEVHVLPCLGSSLWLMV